MHNNDESVTSKDHFIIGDLLDMKITTPEKISEKYMLATSIPPSESYVNLADAVIELLGERNPDELDESTMKLILAEAQTKSEFQRSWGIDAVMKHYNEKCLGYVSLATKAKSEKKTLYTSSQDARAEELKNDLIEGEFTKKYFDPNLVSFNQVEVYWTFKGIEFKSKLDKVIIDKENKEILFTDIKTYYEDFVDNYYKYGYWLQAILYKAPFLLYKDTVNTPTLFKDETFTFRLNEESQGLMPYLDSLTYAIDSSKFIFLTVDKSGKNKPIPYFHWISPTNTMKMFVLTHPKTKETVWMNGWLDKSVELWKHIQNDQWDYPIELIETGKIDI